MTTARIELAPLLPWQTAAIQSPYTHTAMLGGIGSGKSATIPHKIIDHLLNRPHLTGVLGANTHEQLSSATLRETIHWLDTYRIPHVIGRMPPSNWNVKRMVKTYQNVMTIRNPWTHAVQTIFLRIMSDPDALRGLTVSWFILDEVRDTPSNTFDVMLGRMRESDYINSLICTTTNGYDWVYDRFVKNRDRDAKLYGVIRVKTIEAVEAGIISRPFYDGLLNSYSPMLARQELFAEHVNAHSGRAYYAGGDKNISYRCPWTNSAEPDFSYPLIIGCDFNFSPAPLVWTVAQLDPDHDRIHVFYEISGTELSTREATQRLIASADPSAYFRIFGDASGNRGQTSNAGEHDYAQIGQELEDAEAGFSIDVDPANPLVKDRVENFNRLLCSATGEISLTYNPDRCPLLHEDVQMVGWKMTQQKRHGKLDDGGDHKRTHASDALGYALFKVLPPTRRMNLVETVPSAIRSEYGITRD